MATRKTPNKRTNTRNTTRRKKATPKKQKSPILFFLSGVFVTVIGVLVWLLITQPETVKNWFVSTDSPEKTELKKDKKAANKKAEDSKLDYHQILTNKELDVKKDPNAKPTANRKYVMQCGASKVKEQAESLKAQIAFIGLQADVSEKNGWYRVRLGPYSSKRAAERDRHKLQNNDFNDCRIW